MEYPIKKTIESRYGDDRIIEITSETEGTISGKSNFIRSSETSIDFEGGPMIHVGEEIIDDHYIRGFEFIDVKDEVYTYKLTLTTIKPL